MKFFIAGIMQGSIVERGLHGQSYRDQIKEIITQQIPEANIYDPLELNKNSLYYDDELGRTTFLRHNKMCGEEVDVLIAYVPEASMGTAIEIWEAWKNGALVLAISPMDQNWAIRFLSHAIYPDLESFKRSVANWSVQNGKLTGWEIQHPAE